MPELYQPSNRLRKNRFQVSWVRNLIYKAQLSPEVIFLQCFPGHPVAYKFDGSELFEQHGIVFARPCRTARGRVVFQR